MCAGGAARQGLLRGRQRHGDQAAGAARQLGAQGAAAVRCLPAWLSVRQRAGARAATPGCNAPNSAGRPAWQPGSMDAAAPIVTSTLRLVVSSTSLHCFSPTPAGGTHGGGHKGPRPGAPRPALAAAGRPHLLHRHGGACWAVLAPTSWHQRRAWPCDAAVLLPTLLLLQRLAVVLDAVRRCCAICSCSQPLLLPARCPGCYGRCNTRC